jgi:hypothetical protein
MNRIKQQQPTRRGFVKAFFGFLFLFLFSAQPTLRAAELRALWVDTWHPALFNAAEVTDQFVDYLP